MAQSLGPGWNRERVVLSAGGHSLPPATNPTSPGGLRPTRPAGAEVLIITTGQAEQNRQFSSEQKIACPVPLQQDMEVAGAYQAQGTPAGI